MAVRRALFLDLDGTVRRSKTGTFIKDADDLEIIPEAKEAIQHYKNHNYLIIGISNQGGVAFGHKTADQVQEESRKTLQELPFDTIIHCYFMEGGTVEPFDRRSLLRKPNYGMIVLAEAQYSNDGVFIDLDNSLFVGDREEDRECAESAKIKFMWADEFLGIDYGKI
jgi:D-glycero-D-manno-heptose 1,7-bisphosphate phosphatase